MGRVRGFILSTFTKNYFLIFLPFLSIMSIVYIIKVAILTSRLSLGGWEIIKLFGFFIPDILFYTIPISFIAALATTFTKLSEDNELIAIFSFGFTPMKIISIFLIPSVLFSILLLTISLVSIPENYISYKLFEQEKLTEAKFAIMPNKLGQKFGEYIVFIGQKDKDAYKDVVLFASDGKDKRVIFMADEANIENNKSRFAMNLYNGTADTFSTDKIESIKYKKMSLYKYPINRINLKYLQKRWSNIYKNKADMSNFTYNVFLSLSPVIVLMIIAAYSIINPRYEQSHTYLVSFAISIAIYAIATFLRKHGTPSMLVLFTLSIILLGAMLFQYRTRRNF